MEVLRIPAQIVITALDFVFLKRPKEFFRALDAAPSRYANPYLFLAVNVSFAGTVFAWAMQSVPEAIGEHVPQDEAIGIFAVRTIIHCIIALVVGRVSGYLLNERTDTASLLSAFCYTSVFYPPTAIAITWAFGDSSGRGPQPLAVIGATVLDLVALAYLLSAMARASELHGRRMLAFATVCSAQVVFVQIVLAFAILVVGRPHHHFSFSVCEATDTWPVIAITLPADRVESDSAVLMGASVGERAGEWFEIGSSRGTEHSVPATNGVAITRDLRPNTEYFFRYVVRHGEKICVGHMESFITKPL